MSPTNAQCTPHCAKPGILWWMRGPHMHVGRWMVTAGMSRSGSAHAKQRVTGQTDGWGMSGQEDPASDSFLSAPPQAAPNSPAAAWLWGGPLWAPSGGQRSSPLSTAPTSLGSTTIEGSRWPSRAPFSRTATTACGEGGQGSWQCQFLSSPLPPTSVLGP